MEVKLSKKQAEQIAKAVICEISAYVGAHQEEFEAFVATENEGGMEVVA